MVALATGTTVAQAAPTIGVQSPVVQIYKLLSALLIWGGIAWGGLAPLAADPMQTRSGAAATGMRGGGVAPPDRRKGRQDLDTKPLTRYNKTKGGEHMFGKKRAADLDILAAIKDAEASNMTDFDILRDIVQQIYTVTIGIDLRLRHLYTYLGIPESEIESERILSDITAAADAIEATADKQLQLSAIRRANIRADLLGKDRAFA